MSCVRPSNRSSRLALPSGPSKSYSFSTASHGIRRRWAASASRARVNSFSFTRSCSRAASHRDHRVHRSRPDELVVGADPAVGVEAEDVEATADDVTTRRGHHLPGHTEDVAAQSEDVPTAPEHVLAGCDEHLVGPGHPGRQGLVAADFEQRGWELEPLGGVPDVLGWIDEDLGAVRCPDIAEELAARLRVGLVPQGYPAVDEVQLFVGEIGLVTHAGQCDVRFPRLTIPSREYRRGGLRGITAGMTMLVGPDRFAQELRRWRTRRRWSQLDLAIRAHTTQRYLSFLEQARSRPGRSMVLRLAESLGLSLRERNALLLAAGYAPVFPESTLDSQDLRPVREALSGILAGHMPYPAVVVRPYGEVVAANAALSVLTEGATPELLRPPVNVLRLGLHPDGMGPRVENLGEWGRHVIESLRSQAVRSPDPRLDAFIAELESYVPPAGDDPNHLGFAVPLRLRCGEGVLHLITTLTSFATAVDVTLSELHLEAFLPADDATAEILHRRAGSDQHDSGPP